MYCKQTTIDILAWDRGRSDEAELASASGEGLLLEPGQATVFRLPGVHLDNHWVRTGFVSNNEYSVDLRNWYGLELEAELPLAEPLELTVEIGLLRDKGSLPEELEYVHYDCLLVRPESGINKVVVPFDQFDDMKALAGKWKYVRSVHLLATWKEESIRPATGSGISIRQLKLSRSRGIHVHAPVLSRSADARQVAEYKLELTNCTGDVQTLTLTQERYGWETMKVSINPEVCLLEPGASCEVSVQVEVSGRVAPGGHEVQKLAIIPGGRGDLAERVELITLRALPHPYIKLVEPEWEEVQVKIQEHAWASELLVCMCCVHSNGSSRLLGQGRICMRVIMLMKRKMRLSPGNSPVKKIWQKSSSHFFAALLTRRMVIPKHERLAIRNWCMRANFSSM